MSFSDPTPKRDDSVQVLLRKLLQTIQSQSSSAGAPIVSSGAIVDLTPTQQAAISEGTVVTTTDGRRWVYSGTGSKVLEASYVEIGDITPDWAIITNRPQPLLDIASATYLAASSAKILAAAGLSTVTTDNSVPRYDGIVGKTQTSAITISDAAANVVTVSTTAGNALTIATLDTNQPITLAPHGTGQLITVLSNAIMYAGTQTGPTLLTGDSGVQYVSTGNYSGLSNTVYANGVANVYPYFHALLASGTAGAPTNAVAGALQGSFLFGAYANGQFRQNAEISMTTDAGFGNTEYGGTLAIRTKSGIGGMTSRITIDKDGIVTMLASQLRFTSQTTGPQLLDTAGAFSIVGGAGNTTITAGTGNSRTLILQSTTSVGVATTALTIDASQNTVISGTKLLKLGASSVASIGITSDDANGTIQIKTSASGGISLLTGSSTGSITMNSVGTVTFSPNGTTAFVFGGTSGAGTITGGTGNLTITSGQGNSRLMILKTTTSVGASTTALTLGADQSATFAGPIIGSVQALSGAGAINITQLTTAFTSTGAAQALTLANGTAGQIKTIVHVVDGGSGVLTPTTAIGYTTITFVNVGDTVALQYTAQGWAVIGSKGAVIA